LVQARGIPADLLAVSAFRRKAPGAQIGRSALGHESPSRHLDRSVFFRSGSCADGLWMLLAGQASGDGIEAAPRCEFGEDPADDRGGIEGGAV
jgi:hypothetical protein